MVEIQAREAGWSFKEGTGPEPLYTQQHEEFCWPRMITPSTHDMPSALTENMNFPGSPLLLLSPDLVSLISLQHHR